MKGSEKKVETELTVQSSYKRFLKISSLDALIKNRMCRRDRKSRKQAKEMENQIQNKLFKKCVWVPNCFRVPIMRPEMGGTRIENNRITATQLLLFLY